MHKFMFLKAIKITMPRTNAKTPLKIYFLEWNKHWGKSGKHDITREETKKKRLKSKSMERIEKKPL